MSRRHGLAIVALAFLGLWAGVASADSVTGYVSLARSDGALGFAFTGPGGAVNLIGGPLLPGELLPGPKRDKIVALLQANGYTASAVGADGYRIDGLPPGTKVEFRPQGTMEERDALKAKNPLAGTIGFTGTFNPFDSLTSQPAVFTAGIVTDVGELTAQVSAQELNFQTDGPIICQALFQRLQPHAPQYGATINYAGDRLEVYFDPAYSVGPSGVIWGVTSDNYTPAPEGQRHGAYGSVTLVPLPAGLWMGLGGMVAVGALRAARVRRVVGEEGRK